MYIRIITAFYFTYAQLQSFVLVLFLLIEVHCILMNVLNSQAPSIHPGWIVTYWLVCRRKSSVYRLPIGSSLSQCRTSEGVRIGRSKTCAIGEMRGFGHDLVSLQDNSLRWSMPVVAVAIEKRLILKLCVSSSSSKCRIQLGVCIDYSLRICISNKLRRFTLYFNSPWL
jgi:hypothetical protein